MIVHWLFVGADGHEGRALQWVYVGVIRLRTVTNGPVDNYWCGDTGTVPLLKRVLLHRKTAYIAG